MTPETASATTAPETAEEEPLLLEPGELEEVQAIFAALEKTVRVYRLYPENNRIFIDFTQDLTDRIGRFLEARHQLDLVVEEDRFLYKRRVAHEDPNRSRSLPAHFFRDAIRGISFYEGLEREEVMGFLDVVTHRPDPDDIEDDLVTMLWEKDFAHLKYFVLDDGAGEEAPDTARPIREATDDPEDAEIPGLTKGKKEKYFAPKLSTRTLSAVLTITDHDLAAVKEMIAHENARDLRHDLTTLLFEMLGLQDEAGPFETNVGILTQLASGHLRTGSLREVVEILRKFRELLDAGMPASREAVVLRAIGDLAARENLVEAGKAFELPIIQNQQDLNAFFRLVGPSAIPVLLDIIPRARNAQVVTALVTELAAVSPDGLLVRASDRNPAILRCVLSMLATLGDPSLAPYVEPHLHHPEVSVRLEAVRTLGKFGGERGRRGLLAALADSEYQVRIHALRCMEEMNVVEMLPALIAITDGREFPARNQYEKQEVFRTIARLGGESALPFLASTIEKRGLFRTARSEEIRACAAGALSAIPGNAARHLLERHRNSASRAVKEACEMALRRLRTERETPGGGPS